MNLNKVFIIGNLTRDPEKRSLPSGQAVVSFGIATNRFYKDQQGNKQQEVEFHNVVAFGRLAEIVCQYLQKGSTIFVEGRIKTRNWQDAAGVKHYRTEIIAESLQLGPRLNAVGPSAPFRGNAANEDNPRMKSQIAEEEIPVIEEPSGGSASPRKNFNEEEEEEIDIKDIPF